MVEFSDVYIEKIAIAARQRLIEKQIINNDTRDYNRKLLEEIISFFGGQLKTYYKQNNETEESNIEKNSEHDFTIFLAENNNKRGFSFIEALHELGHAFLDLPSMKIGEKRYCGGNSASDIYAQHFARAFVMPKSDFCEAAKKCVREGKFDVQKIADSFNVDYFDAFIRGKELNYWE